ncbi:MAG: cytochrome C oxidase subunit IV family protein [Candidatus Methylomirabilales bacterium]
MAHTVLPARLYLLVFAALMALTAITLAVAFTDLGGFLNFGNLAAALGIAATKSILVVLFFMHLKQSSRLTWVVAGGVVLWLVIALALTMADYLSRQWIPAGAPWS